MRVLQLGKYYQPRVGGIETHLRLLSQGLAERGFEVEVLVHGSGVRTLHETIEGISVTRVGALARLMSAEISPALVTELSRSYDILHLHTPHPVAMLAYLAARTPKHRLVITHHSDIVRQARARELLGPALRRVMTRADAIVVTSKAYLDSSEELTGFREKTTIIPYGIDLDRFSPACRDLAAARALRAQHGERVVLSTGRLIYYKGFDVLIDALKSVRGKLLLVGDGPLRPELERRARSNGVAEQVVFLGSIPNDDLPNLYGAADVFVLPSIARSEAFGIVQIEALACGLPVVNTSIDSGVPEVSVHGITGYTVPPNDPSALASAVNQLLDQPEEARRFGLEGRRRALGRFTTERMLESVVSLYGGLGDSVNHRRFSASG